MLSWIMHFLCLLVIFRAQLCFFVMSLSRRKLLLEHAVRPPIDGVRECVECNFKFAIGCDSAAWHNHWKARHEVKLAALLLPLQPPAAAVDNQSIMSAESALSPQAHCRTWRRCFHSRCAGAMAATTERSCDHCCRYPLIRCTSALSRRTRQGSTRFHSRFRGAVHDTLQSVWCENVTRCAG